MATSLDIDRLYRGYDHVRDLLLAERTPDGHWTGELSTSALSTATAVMALIQVRSAGAQPDRHDQFDAHISSGINWLLANQNKDGGWGDTIKSLSNISTTMLCRASLVAQAMPLRDEGRVSKEGGDLLEPRDPAPSTLDDSLTAATTYIDDAGGIPALIARYGKDKTFSIPILTHCALAGLVDWKEITPLPFELACVPARFYKTVRLPVVSYALPALIAIGQVRHHFAPTWNPITRVLRNLSVQRSLKILERIQPTNGGFLEATPLTSFVTMSLAAKGLADHPVVSKGVQFIIDSVRDDGSWPIDTNLATWVTTLSVNALGNDLPEESRVPIMTWLLDQQYTEEHPYTNADPGGWSWTDLPGGVPDADDTPGAILALLELRQVTSDKCQVQESCGVGSPGSRVQSPELIASAAEAGLEPSSFSSSRSGTPSREVPLRSGEDELTERVERAVARAVDWLISLQNRDGGFPTFCRGWGTLPFDRSSPDITAHTIRAIVLKLSRHECVTYELEDDETESLVERERKPADVHWFLDSGSSFCDQEVRQYRNSVPRSFEFLTKRQLPDGAWLPLWFGNQHAPDDINPTYGTAKVLAAYRDCDLLAQEPAQRGLNWLRTNQNADGGWGAGPGTPSSVEETALAIEILLEDPRATEQVVRGLGWLLDRIDDGTIAEPSPIGFYFAKLWYFESLYPLIFAVSCLRRAVRRFEQESPPKESRKTDGAK